MTTTDPDFAAAEEREARRARLFTKINTADKWFQVLGLALLWLFPGIVTILPDLIQN